MSATKDNVPKMEEAKANRMDLDRILVEEIGQFGKFQIRILIVAMIAVIYSAWGGNEYVFTTARIPTRCRIQECEAADADFNPDWLLNAIPGTDTSTGNFDQCNRYVNVNASAQSLDECPSHWFDQDVQVNCEEYLYETQNTVVYDYGLACDEWRRSLIGSARMVGVFVAMPLAGYVSDRWGRRTAFTISLFNTAWLGLARYFAGTYIGFIVSEVAEAVFGAGGFPSIYILVMEAMGPKYRVGASAFLHTFFSVGLMLMGLIAWGVPYWRHLTLALYVPILPTIVLFWITTESVRWLLSKERYGEAEFVLKKIAKTNGKELSDKSLEALKRNAEVEKMNRLKLLEERKTEPWLIVLVFRHKQILLRCCITPVWWMTSTFIYYGLAINAVNMAGNSYVNYIAVAAANIPGYWAAMLLLNRVGRKPVLIIAFLLCAVCQIAYMFLPKEQYALSLVVYLVGTCCIAAVLTSIYVFTTELYPTKYRNNLFSFSSMMGRIGSLLAPLTPALGATVWEHLPFALFASMALLSGALVFLAPETRGTKLPDTMEDASNLGKKVDS